MGRGLLLTSVGHVVAPITEPMPVPFTDAPQVFISVLDEIRQQDLRETSLSTLAK